IAMTSLFAAEAARTRDARQQTQLRQLLLAALPIAREEIAARGNLPRDVQCPVPLAGASLTLHIEPAATGTHIFVEARIVKTAARQTLDFSTSGELTAVSLPNAENQAH